jgi:hypothetical protein
MAGGSDDHDPATAAALRDMAAARGENFDLDELEKGRTVSMLGAPRQLSRQASDRRRRSASVLSARSLPAARFGGLRRAPVSFLRLCD